jgi:uncharacterized protein with LGFP repeats
MPHINGVAISDDFAQLWARFADFLGDPASPDIAAEDGAGRTQPFAKGVIASHPEIGTHALWGPIGVRWLALGGTRFGYPESEQGATIDGAGLMVQCRQVSGDKAQTTILWTSRHGAHGLSGPIRARWSRAGFWVDSPGDLLPPNALGYPSGDATAAFDGVGQTQAFANGVVSWHPQTGAFGVLNPVATLWRAQGGEEFGYPVSEKLAMADGGVGWRFRALHLPGQPERVIVADAAGVRVA